MKPDVSFHGVASCSFSRHDRFEREDGTWFCARSFVVVNEEGEEFKVRLYSNKPDIGVETDDSPPILYPLRPSNV